jgi:hypothetical protein
MGKLGYVKLRVTCPKGETLCRVDLQLRRRDRIRGRKGGAVGGGKTRTFDVRIQKTARKKIADTGSLRVVARSPARDSAGNRAVTSRRITILAPRRR